MIDLLMSWLSTDPGICATFGFAVYAVFMTWKKCSARWNTWFPLLSKVVKWLLYGAAAATGILGLVALNSGLTESPNVFFALAGGLLGPLFNFAAGLIRPKEKVRRGARIAAVKDVNKATHKDLPSSDFKQSFDIGGVDVPRSAEPYHFCVVGATGTGKSVAITNLLDHIEARGDVALVVDSGGEFSSRYYREGRDHILNPFDDRCTPWSPTAELEGPWDAESLAKSMVPDGVGDNKEWNAYAQTLVTSVLRQLVKKGKLSIKDLLYYVQAAPMEELGPFLAGTPAAAQLVSEKTFGSIRTIATNYLATYAYLQDHQNPFSVAKFIRAEKPGFLFLTYRDDQLDSLRNMISCALDVAARTILAMPANSERRVWLIIDEFASIGRVQSIEAVATKARKMGGCLLIGLQSVSQLKERYGEHTAQTILSCLSSWLVLRCSDVDTAEYISKYIGETEISRMTRGESSSDSGGSDSLSEQIQTQRAVLPVELQRLANLKGFFKLAGNYPICSVKLRFPKKRPKVAVNYALRDFDAKPMLNLLNEETTKDSPTSQGAAGRAMEKPLEQVSDPREAPSLEAEPLSATARVQRAGIRVKKSPMDAGPIALNKVLTELAEAYEDGR